MSWTREQMREYQRAYYRRNKQKCDARSRDWYAKNKLGRQRHNYQYRYGQLPDKQPKVCELCSKSRKLYVDHDHTTGKIRGWLCAGCNTGLGKLGDSLVGLIRAVQYLKRQERLK
jgi:hypothetical protein